MRNPFRNRATRDQQPRIRVVVGEGPKELAEPTEAEIAAAIAADEQWRDDPRLDSFGPDYDQDYALSHDRTSDQQHEEISKDYLANRITRDEYEQRRDALIAAEVESARAERQAEPTSRTMTDIGNDCNEGRISRAEYESERAEQEATEALDDEADWQQADRIAAGVDEEYADAVERQAEWYAAHQETDREAGLAGGRNADTAARLQVTDQQRREYPWDVAQPVDAGTWFERMPADHEPDSAEADRFDAEREAAEAAYFGGDDPDAEDPDAGTEARDAAAFAIRDDPSATGDLVAGMLADSGTSAEDAEQAVSAGLGWAGFRSPHAVEADYDPPPAGPPGYWAEAEMEAS